MNEDLKAYVDGELPPDAAERLRAALDADPALCAEADALRTLATALRRLPEPEPVGQAATLAALGRRPVALWRSWLPALAACGLLMVVVSGLSRPQGRWVPAGWNPSRARGAGPVVATIPAVRRGAFVRYVRASGGQVRRDGAGLRAFYPPSVHEPLKRHFLLPEDLPWPTDGLRVRLVR